MNMSPLDITFLLVLAVIVIRAMIRGFVEEFGSVAAFFLGVLAAFLFSGLVAPLLEGIMGQSVWNQVVAFLGLFLITYLLVKLFEAGLRNLIERAELENLDKALGFFLGLVEAVLVVFILVFLLYIQPFFEVDALIMESWFGRVLSPFFPYAADIITGGRS